VQETVKPVITDTSSCPDFVDVLIGNREPDETSVIEFNEKHNISTSITQCTVAMRLATTATISTPGGTHGRGT